ncbi:hypothetical protein ASPWEDRAFT_107312 [Aspergillus wentii DTO 134E9]|uniref:Ubiquitin-like domain-containing protein n=1 Tax=Aspergillus wentii DTO 134E9 TaxID=1073089 RepID=A0A1L9RPC7_ASPWE|nr:uncharacterized protein ASPWEDRAFT_107312 [Aspergillus wentii DTO 134E9]OJJ36779.1 hypothetical protein ASPWEDRAFT_107312 [Aspergillus wentii DTO 134E9]
MRSFFKRPSWASRGEESIQSDFYRRSGQVYADIIASNKEARESLTTSVGDSPVEDSQTYKFHCISGKDDNICYDAPTDTGGPNLSPTIINDQESLHMSQNTLPQNEPKEEQRIDRHTSKIAGPGNIDPADDVFAILNYSEHGQKTRLDNTLPCEPTQEDPVVQILITSEIENSKPLIVHRKMSQPLKDVRLAWCKRQNLTDKLQSSVFLTWKGRRLFDVTTCNSLGVDRWRFPAIDDDAQVGDGSLRIHMEAATAEPLNFTKKPTLSATNLSAGLESTDIESTEQDALIRVILKCPGLDDFKTKVTPKTQISRLVAAFRGSKQLPSDKHVYLLFDGDRLDPNNCLVDYDIADLDLVDVIIKKHT